MTSALPEQGFLLAIVGLSVSLAGFSGLVTALQRSGLRRPIDEYRLRQIPEMALPVGFLALITPALADSISDPATVIRIAGGAGLLFTLAHLLVLIRRTQTDKLRLTTTNWIVAGVIDIAVILAGTVAISLPTAGAYEWLLSLMVARPGLAFMLALAEVATA